MNASTIHKILNYLILVVLTKLSSIIKVSFVLGSFCAFFSMTSMTIPLIGHYVGTFGAIIVFSFSLLMRIIFGYSFSLKIAAFYIPGLCASIYLARRTALWAVIVPFVCIGLFLFHPVGREAFVYSFYWVIPMVLFFVPSRIFIKDAFIATFIAHAVGSVIWLYTQPETVFFWISLIPLVAIERIGYALGMLCLKKIISFLYEESKAIQCSLHVYFEKVFKKTEMQN